MGTLKWISQTLGKRKWILSVICIIECLLAVSGIVFALIMRQAIDHAVAGEMKLFWRFVIALAVLILSQIVLRWLERFTDDDARASIENQFRQKAFCGVLRTDYSRMKEYHTGELMNRITSDTLVVTDGVVTLLPDFLSMVVRIVGVLIVMGAIEPKIAAVFLIGGCVVALLSVLPRKWQKSVHKRVQEQDGTVRSFLQESLESLLVIRAFGCEEKVERTSEENMRVHRRVRRTRSHVHNLLGTGLRILIQCGYMFGFVWCGIGILEHRITYGTLTAVIQLIGQIQTPFANIGSTFPKYASMLASAERLMELDSHTWEKEKETSTLSREEVYENLECISFEDVTFSYDGDRTVLEKETFCVNKGDFLAIIGSSGIGKSTIMKLLLSVYEPNEGTITANLRDKKMQLKKLPSGMFAYVPQGNYLMSGPIWQVVGFAERGENIDRKRVEQACKTACAHEFISELPKGYDTILGERGEGLSEGQMQRLAVARAIYSGCPILLLDEATSALDADTERRLIASLKEKEDCTVLLVTHRKEVWKLCDRVLERKES